MTDPYRTPEKPPRRIVQITSSESGDDRSGWSIVVHALDEQGDVWRIVTTPDKGDAKKPMIIGRWFKLPPIPQDEETLRPRT